MKKTERIGEKFMTNEGYEIEIIEYFKWNNCTIKFEDTTILKNIQYGHIKNGNVKNPNHKSVHNTGFKGVGEYNCKTHLKIYNVWQSMIERCYSEKSQKKTPSYKEVIVCEEWHNFQNFVEWAQKNYIEGFDLDKDIIIKDNKIYSSNTCAFVPKVINSIFKSSKNCRGFYPIGVSKNASRFKSEISINNKKIFLGTFDTPEEAFKIYKVSKEKYMKEEAEKWKGLISEKVYQAMYNYQVEITD